MGSETNLRGWGLGEEKMKKEEEFSKIIGRGVYSQSGVSFHGDRAIITKDGVSKEVSREEGAAEVHRIMSGGTERK